MRRSFRSEKIRKDSQKDVPPEDVRDAEDCSFKKVRKTLSCMIC